MHQIYHALDSVEKEGQLFYFYFIEYSIIKLK